MTQIPGCQCGGCGPVAASVGYQPPQPRPLLDHWSLRSDAERLELVTSEEFRQWLLTHDLALHPVGGEHCRARQFLRFMVQDNEYETKAIRCSHCNCLIACGGDPGPAGAVRIPGDHIHDGAICEGSKHNGRVEIVPFANVDDIKEFSDG